MLLEDRVTIEAPPERIFRFFEELDRNYLAWHPAHIVYRWLDAGPVGVGTRFYFEETVGEELLRQTGVVTRIVTNEFIEVAPANPLVRLVIPRMSFAMRPLAGACEFVARIAIRFGPLVMLLHGRQIAAVRRHMREEGENLKRLLEA